MVKFIQKQLINYSSFQGNYYVKKYFQSYAVSIIFYCQIILSPIHSFRHDILKCQYQDVKSVKQNNIIINHQLEIEESQMMIIKKGCFNREKKMLSLSKQNQTTGKILRKSNQPLILNITSKSKLPNNIFQNIQTNIVLKGPKLSLDQNSSKSKELSNMKPMIKIPDSQQQLTLHSNRKSFRRTSRRSKTGIEHPMTQIQLQLDLMLQSLKTNNVLNSNHMNSFVIKRQDLAQLLQKMIYYQLDRTSSIFTQNIAVFPFVNSFLSEIKKRLKIENNILQSKHFQIHSKTISLKRTSESYEKEVDTVQTQLAKSLSKKIQIQKQIMQLQEKKNFLQKNNDDIEKNMAKMSKKYYGLIENISENQTKWVNILEQIKIQSQKLKHIHESSQKILTYVDDQTKNKLVKLASDHYKDVESEIYQYASYLQCNALASSLEFQPVPFHLLTKDVESDMKKINKTIIQNQEMSAVDKFRLMRDFLMESIQKYRKKDEEREKLLLFRTKCVRNFIDKMKRLLDNWELKQEYLVNLRNEFGFDSESLIKQMMSLQDLPVCEVCKSTVGHKKNKLLSLYQKIELNYKMGNSFY